MGKGVPDRWESYSNMGRQIPGTRFFAFKVPLKPASLNNLPVTVDPFSPGELMDQCPSLGLVIDLTNTNRYYDPELFVSEGIEYEKIKTEGHVIPKHFVVERFFKVVESFLEENEWNDKLIGVHCTHGVNRTGYLICRYMIQQLGIPPNQAISDFNRARGHALERENYLENLRRIPWRRGAPPTRPSRGQEFRTRPSRDNGPSRDNDRISNSFEGYFSPPFVPRFNSSLEGATPPDMPRFNNFSERDTPPPPPPPPRISRFNSSSEGATPPYMPHQSRRIIRGGPHSPVVVRLSRSPIGRETSFGTSSFRKIPDPMAGPSRHPSRRGGDNYPNFSDSGNRNQEATMDGEKFRSPVFGKNYYEQDYKGHVLPQYDVDFYSRGREMEGGPRRPQPRNIPRPPQDQRPRVYRDSRPYRSPPRLEEPFQEEQYTNRPTPRTSYFRGSGRRSFSPGTPDNVFNPENEGGRKRYSRLQPF